MSLPPDEIRRELAPLEQVLWSGRPRQGMLLRASDALQIPFSLFWCGFIAFWEHGVIEAGSVFMMLWGIPFILVGAYLLIGRFFHDAWLRAYTDYAVTSQRVLIVTTLFTRKVRSLELASLGEMSLTERRDGRGSLVFGRETTRSSGFGGDPGWVGASRHAAPRFDLIEGARGVQQIIRDAAARLSR